MNPDKRHLLLILDGYGIAEDPSVSAIDQAQKPFLDELFACYPHSTLQASGRQVGLPAGQMGNSEVGHMNLGAGRVVYQEISRIDKDIEEGEFDRNKVLAKAMDGVGSGGRLHLLGLFSAGGVHAHFDHLIALVQMAAERGLARDQVLVHAFTDGRDTDPRAGLDYVRRFQAKAQEIGVGRIATIVGRYYAMDRDRRWERIKLAYDLLARGQGAAFETATEALEASYADGVTDEFVLPSVIGAEGRVRAGDAVIFYNYRADRARQLTRAFTVQGFNGFDRPYVALDYVTFAPYDSEFDLPIAFPKVNLSQTMGQVISGRGGTQLRAAETEKYPHVTYFYSGGREEPFPGESRIMVPSPKVATYDLQPEMSARPLAHQVARFLQEASPNFAVLNFANPDMVGHTGVMEAAVKAVETVDACARIVVEAALEAGYSVSIIADHGNADRMRNPDGSPHTAHTTVLVPHLIIKDGFQGPVKPGKLGDIAPTILALMGEEPPPKMTGQILI